VSIDYVSGFQVYIKLTGYSAAFTRLSHSLLGQSF
jgi:hypothetical protein